MMAPTGVFRPPCTCDATATPPILPCPTCIAWEKKRSYHGTAVTAADASDGASRKAMWEYIRYRRLHGPLVIVCCGTAREIDGLPYRPTCCDRVWFRRDVIRANIAA